MLVWKNEIVLPPPPFLSPESSLETNLLMKARCLHDFQNVIASIGI